MSIGSENPSKGFYIVNIETRFAITTTKEYYLGHSLALVLFMGLELRHVQNSNF